jgi:hypothetical protein
MGNMLSSFTKEGIWRGRYYYTFKRSRMKSPTECYEIWLEYPDEYIAVAKTTLLTALPDQVASIVEYAKQQRFPVHTVFSEIGERLF